MECVVLNAKKGRCFALRNALLRRQCWNVAKRMPDKPWFFKKAIWPTFSAADLYPGREVSKFTAANDLSSIPSFYVESGKRLSLSDEVIPLSIYSVRQKSTDNGSIYFLKILHSQRGSKY